MRLLPNVRCLKFECRSTTTHRLNGRRTMQTSVAKRMDGFCTKTVDGRVLSSIQSVAADRRTYRVNLPLPPSTTQSFAPNAGASSSVRRCRDQVIQMLPVPTSRLSPSHPAIQRQQHRQGGRITTSLIAPSSTPTKNTGSEASAAKPKPRPSRGHAA
jgi:hypothetical protein